MLIEYVNGIVIAAKTAGPDSAISFHSMSVIFLTKRIAHKLKQRYQFPLGKLVANGEKNRYAKNKTPITKDVIPVFPPALTPAPDST